MLKAEISQLKEKVEELLVRVDFLAPRHDPHRCKGFSLDLLEFAHPKIEHIPASSKLSIKNFGYGQDPVMHVRSSECFLSLTEDPLKPDDSDCCHECDASGEEFVQTYNADPSFMSVSESSEEEESTAGSDSNDSVTNNDKQKD